MISLKIEKTVKFGCSKCVTIRVGCAKNVEAEKTTAGSTIGRREEPIR